MPVEPAADPDARRRRLEALGAALRAGRGDQAQALAETMLADGFAHPVALHLAAAARQRDGRFDEAIALFDHRARMTPSEPAGWAALAACLAAARRPEASLAAYDKALALAPDVAAVLCGKARVLQGLSRPDAAEALFRRALAADPEAFEARFGLALLALETGDLDAAEAAVRGLPAGRPDAGWLAARIALARGEAEAARARLAPILANPALAPDQRAESLLLDGEALDALGQPAEAFAAAVQGKAIQRRLHAGRAAGREGETDKLRRLGAWFAAADPQPWRAAPTAEPVPGEAWRHVFLVGFPRSGTTLLEQVLAGHPDVEALEEAPTLAEPYAEFLSSDAGLARLAAIGPAEAQAWRARYWAGVEALGARAAGRVFLDKAPAGTLYLPLIAKLFPTAKVLFALRDPRDVVLSCLRNAFQLNAMTYAFTDLAETAACYGAGMAMAEAYRRVLPLDLREVRHEALVEDFDAELAAVAGFLGIEVVPAMADVAATARRRSVRTPSARQVREGLNRRGLGRWRAYAAELAPVMAELAPWVERFGYAGEGRGGGAAG
ncbi:MAG: sulfotransferase [Caulobacteraceae bacterium]|nr:sulfotransferase [Caulobacteraceae bacterium]